MMPYSCKCVLGRLAFFQNCFSDVSTSLLLLCYRKRMRLPSMHSNPVRCTHNLCFDAPSLCSICWVIDMDMDISTMISVHYIRGLLLRRCYLSPFSTSLFSWTSRSAYYLDIPLIRITPHHCEYLHFHVSFTLVHLSTCHNLVAHSAAS